MRNIYINGKIITGGRIICGKTIIAENGRICETADSDGFSSDNGNIIDLDGRYIAPGFIDIHCHGGNGYEFIDGTVEAVVNACKIHEKHGTRVILPTISATDYDTMYKALEAIESAKNLVDIDIPGVHLEGPYLALEMCGGQSPDLIHPPVREEYESLYNRFGNLIKRWTYAPEFDKNNEFVDFLSKHSIIPSTGHSAAVYDDMERAFRGGNALVTHLYSCTSTVTRNKGFRSLGVVESAFLNDDIFVEAIGDGKHLPYELLQMIVKIKGADRVCLITDALRPGGTGEENDGKEFRDCPVPFVIEDGVAKLLDRSAFAGSIATADILLRTGVDAGIPLEEVVRMLTETPAEAAKINGKGRIKPGYDECFTVFDDRLQIYNL